MDYDKTYENDAERVAALLAQNGYDVKMPKDFNQLLISDGIDTVSAVLEPDIDYEIEYGESYTDFYVKGNDERKDGYLVVFLEEHPEEEKHEILYAVKAILDEEKERRQCYV